ncbi:MAG: hypothetical protein AAF799_01680 [Myxococcota bacterium]
MISLSRPYAMGTAFAGLFLLGACFSPEPIDSDDGSSSTASAESSGNPAPPVCIPGETQTCLCLGGQDGVQACNAGGNGFDACECPDGGSTSGIDPATSSSGGDETTGALEGTGDSSSGGESSGDTGPVDVPPHEGPYGHCFDSPCDLPEEVCATTQTMDNNICIPLGCKSPADCPPIEQNIGAQIQCVDVTGDGTGDCTLTCTAEDDCFDGAMCFGLNEKTGKGGICVWPNPPA